MIVTCIACTHEHESQIVVPGGDLLICAGDVSFYGDPVPIGLFCQWLERQPYKKKVFIAGNHDFLFQEDPILARDIYSAYDITYLQDSSIEFEGKKIYGYHGFQGSSTGPSKRTTGQPASVGKKFQREPTY